MAELKEGSKAPAFNVVADDGKKVALKDFRGKNVILYFYPKDMTPGCTTQACDFQKALANYKKKKAVVLGVSKDSIERHQKFKDKYGLKFPLLSDEDGKLCKSYGVWKEKSLYGRKFMGIERSTFLINQEGKIEKIFRKVKVKDHVKNLLKVV